ncbi:hypothetical protein BLS_006302 [Venturia inaequalis]|uniref:dual-specificity kinase n=1 Tax=Venturia inaequalis TaxID=5025 RepID=A0A8H3YRP9_VENIN|nr:hypothetical protein EG328_006826 [Venturia inaequalis]KAE9982295.1 hypothetical protein BLS_006302 [Venturia inaequalis]KAE9990644.1 hypothetical protein EG327_001091 [Venturia inaequalis]
MSTPSTATRTHHTFYNSHIYQPNGQANTHSRVNGYTSTSNANTNTAVDNDLRRTATINSRFTTQLPPIQIKQQEPSQTREMSESSRQNGGRKPDWEEFYKNGVPREVIVIDDDSPPPTSKPSLNGRTSNGAVRAVKTAKNGGYDPAYAGHASYSATHTPYDSSSANNTASTDRTQSEYLAQTATTSLGSQTSNGIYLPPLEDTMVGQKRKRTRAAAAEELQTSSKRRELERPSPISKDYVPPQKPILKAKDVTVEIVKDKHHHKDQKVDDEDGHYIVVPEAELTERYTIVRLLGQGTFGKVVEAYDRTKGTRCAIKIIRSVQKYRDASRIELRVLSTLAQNDRHNRNKCIHLRQCFDYRNHICIVTDLYGQSVFDFLKINNFTPFPSSHIQLFARQLLTSVAFLHDLNLIHTDLKPENILLVDNQYQTFTYNRSIPSSSTATQRTSRQRKVLLTPEIRLIDFGSATFNDEYHSSVVSTRHYRAPEIILNLGWSYACDIWSIGCILVEFYTGDALFQTHDNLEHLAMMEAVCGQKLDKSIIQMVMAKERGSTHKNPAAQYFRGREKKLDYPNPETAKASRKYVRAMKRLEDTIQPHSDFNRQFLDLLRKIFVYDPNKRITAKQALKHPWFKEALQDDGTEAARIRDDKLAGKRRLESEAARSRPRDNYH